MRHDQLPNNYRPATPLASAWQTLCSLPATHPWFWLARSGALETAAPVLLVLFDGLSGFLGGSGPGIFRVVCGHG